MSSEEKSNPEEAAVMNEPEDAAPAALVDVSIDSERGDSEAPALVLSESEEVKSDLEATAELLEPPAAVDEKSGTETELVETERVVVSKEQQVAAKKRAVEEELEPLLVRLPSDEPSCSSDFIRIDKDRVRRFFLFGLNG